MHCKLSLLFALFLGFSAIMLQGQALPEENLVLRQEGYPEMELILNRRLPVGASLESGNWQVLENGEAVELMSVELRPGYEGLHVALVFDHSTGWEGTPYSWTRIQQVLRTVLQGFRPQRDSIMLIGFAEEVDMISEWTDNVEMLEIILGTAAELTGQALPEAIETAIDGLAPTVGNKAIIVFSSGYGGEAMTPISAATIPLYLIAPQLNSHWETVAWQSGGMFQEIAPLLSGAIPAQEIATWPNSSSLIRYRTRLDSGASRTVELFSQSMETEGILGRVTYAGTEENQLTIAEPGLHKVDPVYFGYLGGGLVLLLGLGLVWRILRFRTSRNLVQPAITELSYDFKRRKIRAQIDIPQRKKPAKFTLHNHSGTPIRDCIVAGTSRSVAMDVSDIREGIYLCSLSNSGLTSEMRELVLGREG